MNKEGTLQRGYVALVGAGPGDWKLLTLRAVECLKQADVVLYDRLSPQEALAYAPKTAQCIDVGKQGGGPQVPQKTTNELLLEHAQMGSYVVRLKGGDPCVFGRGGEEAQVLAAAGIPFEIVPGISSGIAAPAYTGIPVTQRKLGSAVAFITGHEDPDKPDSDLDWNALAAFPGTLVTYMGVRQLPKISEHLLSGGRNPQEPVAVIERGTLATQRVTVGTLSTIAAQAQERSVRAPAIVVIGDVVNLHDEIHWFSPGPLAGKTIVVTRAQPQAGELAKRLRELGAQVEEVPTISIEPLKADIPKLATFDLLCLTSPNGVERLMELVNDARSLSGPKIAVIGPGTAAKLASYGVKPDIVAKRAVAEGLLEELKNHSFKRALVIRAQEGRSLLIDTLRERGVEVEVHAVYKTVHQELCTDKKTAIGTADAILFASSSAASAAISAGVFNRQTDSLPKIISVGPVTSKTLQENGIEPTCEAEEHTLDGLVQATVEVLKNEL